MHPCIHRPVRVRACWETSWSLSCLHWFPRDQSLTSPELQWGRCRLWLKTSTYEKNANLSTNTQLQAAVGLCVNINDACIHLHYKGEDPAAYLIVPLWILSAWSCYVCEWGGHSHFKYGNKAQLECNLLTHTLHYILNIHFNKGITGMDSSCCVNLPLLWPLVTWLLTSEPEAQHESMLSSHPAHHES